MAKRAGKGFWIMAQGVALVGGWRRGGMTVDDVAGKIGVGGRTLARWASQSEELAAALAVDREVADFMVEDVLFNKSLAGDHKAYEFWLRHRMPEKWGKNIRVADGDDGGQIGLDYVGLAQMINNPGERAMNNE